VTEYSQKEVLSGLGFPVLCFSQGVVLCRDTPEELTEANRLGLKRGWFDDLLIVGVNLVAVRVKGATKLHGVGRFGGWNVFGEQKIRVSLSFASPPEPIALDEVKQHVLRSFEEWEGWST
jgi:hypothetical protein